MLDYNIHDNNWTVFLENFNAAKVSQAQLKHLTDLLLTYPLIIARNQILSIEDEVNLIKSFPSPGPYPIDGDFIVAGSDGLLVKVTQGALFGEPEGLPWHCDNPGLKKNREITYLRSICDSEGSVTSFNNSNLAYEDWPDKEILKDLYCLTESGDTVPIITQYGLFFPAHQILEIKDNNELIDKLGSFIIQEKYCYHHEWKDGDMIFSNQMNSVHKRWAFDKMDSRLLHKAAMGFIL